MNSPFKVLIDLFADRDPGKSDDVEDVCDMAMQQANVQRTLRTINDRSWLTEKLFRTEKYNNPRQFIAIYVDDDNLE